MEFKLNASEDFANDVTELSVPNPKFKQMLKKALPLIEKNPHNDAEQIKPQGYWRKHVISGKYRILYDIDYKNRIINLLHIRLKNKGTYK